MTGITSPTLSPVLSRSERALCLHSELANTIFSHVPVKSNDDGKNLVPLSNSIDTKSQPVFLNVCNDIALRRAVISMLKSISKYRASYLKYGKKLRTTDLFFFPFFLNRQKQEERYNN